MEGSAAIALRDGRQLEYVTVGPEDGAPALFIHGWGASAHCFGGGYCAGQGASPAGLHDCRSFSLTAGSRALAYLYSQPPAGHPASTLG